MSTPWWATISRSESAIAVRHQLGRGGPAGHHAAGGELERGPGPTPEEPALDPGVQPPVGEEGGVVQGDDDGHAGRHRHRVVRRVDDVDRQPPGQPRQRRLLPGQPGRPAGQLFGDRHDAAARGQGGEDVRVGVLADHRQRRAVRVQRGRQVVHVPADPTTLGGDGGRVQQHPRLGPHPPPFVACRYDGTTPSGSDQDTAGDRRPPGGTHVRDGPSPTGCPPRQGTMVRCRCRSSSRSTGIPALLRRTVASVLAQSDPAWTLTVVDDGYPDPAGRQPGSPELDRSPGALPPQRAQPRRERQLPALPRAGRPGVAGDPRRRRRTAARLRRHRPGGRRRAPDRGRHPARRAGHRHRRHRRPAVAGPGQGPAAPGAAPPCCPAAS